MAAHNELGRVLREERQALFQRELLLHTLVQNAPTTMVLCNARGPIVHANTAARRLLHGGRRLEGMRLDDVLRLAPAPLRGGRDRASDPGQVDPGQLDQALINLLKNAHESGTAAGTVELEMTRTPAEWRIEVRDRGPGMSEQVLASALVPFYSTKRSGTGLGLALAREIAEAHGGRISLANREGGGLVARLVLPRDDGSDGPQRAAAGQAAGAGRARTGAAKG